MYVCLSGLCLVGYFTFLFFLLASVLCTCTSMYIHACMCTFTYECMIVKVIFYTTIVVDVMEADMGVEEMDQTTPTSCASSAPTSVIVNITGE